MQALVKPVERLQHMKVWSVLGDRMYEPYPPTHDMVIQDLKMCSIQDLPANSIKRPPATAMDLLEALTESRPSVSPADIKQFEIYNK